MSLSLRDVAGPDLFVFDFDLSLLEDFNTDYYVFQVLAPDLVSDITTVHNANVLQGLSWPDTIDEMLGRLHARGFVPADLKRALSGSKISNAMRDLIRVELSSSALPTSTAEQDKPRDEFLIISDANMFYINEVLTSNGVSQLFLPGRILTNSTSVEEGGCLRVSPFQPPSSPHNCPTCPPHLCKTAALKGALEKMTRVPRRIIYLGDGGGDFCPATALTPSDYVLAKRGCELLRRIRERNSDAAAMAPPLFEAPFAFFQYHLAQIFGTLPQPIQAQVLEWSNGQEVLDLVRTIKKEN